MSCLVRGNPTRTPFGRFNPPPLFFGGLFYYLCGMETKDEEKWTSMYGLHYGKEYSHYLKKLWIIGLRMEMGGNEGIHSSIKK